jgi:hypothetical protein
MHLLTWKSIVLPLNSSNEAESITTSAFSVPASSSATNMVSSSGSTLEGPSSDIRYWKPWQPPEVTVTRRWLGCEDLKGAEESAGEEDVSVICCSLYSVMTLVRCRIHDSLHPNATTFLDTPLQLSGIFQLSYLFRPHRLVGSE